MTNEFLHFPIKIAYKKKNYQPKPIDCVHGLSKETFAFQEVMIIQKCFTLLERERERNDMCKEELTNKNLLF